MPTKPDLSQPADLHWVPADETPKGAAPEWVGERRQFASLREAVLFAMTELPESEQVTAWIGDRQRTALP
jgi:hypothetical protein